MRRPDRCTNCGRSDWFLTYDNFGAPYMGCANCVILVSPYTNEGRTPQPSPASRKDPNG